MDANLKAITPAELAAKTGMSLDEAAYTLDVARGEWAGDVLAVDDGNATPEHHGENYQAE